MIGGPSIEFGDNVNTDTIIPARYLVSIDPLELADHAFEPLGPEVQRRLRESKVVVGGINFGCGSAREQAASCLVGVGIQAVVAKSFARAFFRNAINNALPVITSPEAVDAIEDGSEVFIDIANGQIVVGSETFVFAPYPAMLLEILEAGGLTAYVARQLHESGVA